MTFAQAFSWGAWLTESSAWHKGRRRHAFDAIFAFCHTHEIGRFATTNQCSTYSRRHPLRQHPLLNHPTPYHCIHNVRSLRARTVRTSHLPPKHPSPSHPLTTPQPKQRLPHRPPTKSLRPPLRNRRHLRQCARPRRPRLDLRDLLLHDHGHQGLCAEVGHYGESGE